MRNRRKYRTVKDRSIASGVKTKRKAQLGSIQTAQFIIAPAMVFVTHRQQRGNLFEENHT
jgi:hypothetical protein